MSKGVGWVLTGILIVGAAFFFVITVGGIIFMVRCEYFGEGSECGMAMLAIVPAAIVGTSFVIGAVFAFQAARRA